MLRASRHLEGLFAYKNHKDDDIMKERDTLPRARNIDLTKQVEWMHKHMKEQDEEIDRRRRERLEQEQKELEQKASEQKENENE